MDNTISFNTKFGQISATETKGKVTSIQFKRLKKKGLSSINLRKLRSNINAYFKGKINNIKIPIKIAGNPMQKKVWNELKRIKKGETKSYGQIAKKFKLSPRHIGKICSQNKLVLLVPCHRVIRNNGTLGGFTSAGGIKLKRKLLEFEKA